MSYPAGSGMPRGASSGDDLTTVADEGPTVASCKMRDTLSFVLDRTYLCGNNLRNSALHPVVLESLPAPMTEVTVSPEQQKFVTMAIVISEFLSQTL